MRFYVQEFNAATDEERQQINAQANALRSSYGNYTGGADGSQYISTGLLNQKVDDQTDRIDNYGPFSYDVAAPAYTNQYAQQQAALLNEILNRKDFEWSKEADPNWSAYKKEYLREGDRATANALAQASAASGGRASSYAVNAASQAGDYYAGQLADKIPELYQQAYERYLTEQQLKYSDLSALNSQEQLEYAKYLNELSQYNTGYQNAYNEYLNNYNMLQNQLANLQGQQQTEFNQNLTVRQYQDQLAQYQDQLKQQEIANALNLAQVFGYVPENGAKALGIAAGTPTADQAYNNWYMAQQAAKAASGSTGGSGGGSSGGSEGDPGTGEAGNVYSRLIAAGATDYGTAYAMLLNAGYGTMAAKELANYFNDIYYPGQMAGGGYKELKYKDLSDAAKKISDYIDSDLTTDYTKALDWIEQLNDENERYYLAQQLKAYLK